MECKFCQKTFSTKYVLKNHQRTVKSCLKMQEQQCIQPETKVYECVYCNKHVTTKGSLTHHYKICPHNKKNMEENMEKLSYAFNKSKEEMEVELHKKDKEINDLKDKLLKSKTPPKITNKTNIENKTNIGTNIENQTNNITIYQVMTPEHVLEVFQKHYNLDTLLGGQKALARFVNDGFLKEAPMYLCGDRSRQKFYIVKDGKKTEDPDCDEILGLTSPGMPHVQEVYETALFNELPKTITEDDLQDNYQHLMTLDEQRADFKAELSKILSTEPSQDTFKNMIRAMKTRSHKLGLTERDTKNE